MDIRRSLCPKEDASRALTDALRGRAEAPTLLLVSGGSALSILEGVLDDALGSFLTICVLDERFSSEPSVNNFLQLSTTLFFERAKERGAAFIETVPFPEESLVEFAKRFEDALHAWCEMHPEGEIVATMGIGADGHTAGLFPGMTDPEDTRWVIASHLPEGVNPYPERASVSFEFLLNEVRTAVVYASGEEKRNPIERLERGEKDLRAFPASAILSIRHATLFTDTLQ